MGKRERSRILEKQANAEGAGVHLKRAFGFQKFRQLDPFSSWTTSFQQSGGIPRPAFPGIPIGGSRRSPTFSRKGGARRQHGEQGDYLSGMCRDDRRNGSSHQEIAQGVCRGADVGLPALGQSSGVPDR